MKSTGYQCFSYRTGVAAFPFLFHLSFPFFCRLSGTWNWFSPWIRLKSTSKSWQFPAQQQLLTKIYLAMAKSKTHRVIPFCFDSFTTKSHPELVDKSRDEAWMTHRLYSNAFNFFPFSVFSLEGNNNNKQKNTKSCFDVSGIQQDVGVSQVRTVFKTLSAGTWWARTCVPCPSRGRSCLPSRSSSSTSSFANRGRSQQVPSEYFLNSPALRICLC